ncbi:hypothetical protein Tsubulata_026884, partial [Turnera subulata]
MSNPLGSGGLITAIGVFLGVNLSEFTPLSDSTSLGVNTMVHMGLLGSNTQGGDAHIFSMQGDGFYRCRAEFLLHSSLTAYFSRGI